MELLDQVNEKDEVIGTTNKAEAHEKGLVHRVAAVYAFNSKGELLVQHRNINKDGLLDHSVGGHVKQGESYADAAKREAFEELGITKPLSLLGTFYSDERQKDKCNMIHYFGLYEVRLTPEEVKALVLQESEVDSLIPMTLQDIAKDMKENRSRYTGGFVRSLNYYVKIKGLDIPHIEF